MVASLVEDSAQRHSLNSLISVCDLAFGIELSASLSLYDYLRQLLVLFHTQKDFTKVFPAF